MLLSTVVVLTLLCSFSNANPDKEREALIRADLANAKSIEDALYIIKKKYAPTSLVGRAREVTIDMIESEAQEIINKTQELNNDSDSRVIVPHNGRCEPRVVCEEVQLDGQMNNGVPFPQCIEVHRCGGCCQDGPYQCIPVQEESVTFGPVLLISMNNNGQYDSSYSKTLQNHTKCECKCAITEAECRKQSKTFDPSTCQCTTPNCQPNCGPFQTCSFVHGSETPRCVCNRPIKGQFGNYCRNPNERPDYMCKGCVKFSG